MLHFFRPKSCKIQMLKCAPHRLSLCCNKFYPRLVFDSQLTRVFYSWQSSCSSKWTDAKTCLCMLILAHYLHSSCGMTSEDSCSSHIIWLMIMLMGYHHVKIDNNARGAAPINQTTLLAQDWHKCSRVETSCHTDLFRPLSHSAWVSAGTITSSHPTITHAVAQNQVRCPKLKPPTASLSHKSDQRKAHNWSPKTAAHKIGFMTHYSKWRRTSHPTHWLRKCAVTNVCLQTWLSWKHGMGDESATSTLV